MTDRFVVDSTMVFADESSLNHAGVGVYWADTMRVCVHIIHALLSPQFSRQANKINWLFFELASRSQDSIRIIYDTKGRVCATSIAISSIRMSEKKNICYVEISSQYALDRPLRFVRWNKIFAFRYLSTISPGMQHHTYYYV